MTKKRPAEIRHKTTVKVLRDETGKMTGLEEIHSEFAISPPDKTFDQLDAEIEAIKLQRDHLRQCMAELDRAGEQIGLKKPARILK
jgi:hypothetical protein